jgi:hypothetical protein
MQATIRKENSVEFKQDQDSPESGVPQVDATPVKGRIGPVQSTEDDDPTAPAVVDRGPEFDAPDACGAAMPEPEPEVADAVAEFPAELRINPMQPWTFPSSLKATQFFDSLGYFRASKNGIPFVFRRVVGETGQLVMEECSHNQFREKHVNKTVMVVSGEQVTLASAANEWLKTTDQVYDCVQFAPGESHPTTTGGYNLWRGFAFRPRRTGKAGSYLQFVRNVICSGDGMICDYLLDLMAQQVQSPGVKKGAAVAVALSGEQGIGKSFFVEHYLKLWGNAAVKVNNLDHFLGQFNSLQRYKVVAFLDEVSWVPDQKKQLVLKDLITGDLNVVNQKYRDHAETANFLRLFMSTNDDWSAPVEGMDDRRFLCLEVDTTYQRNNAYFAAIERDLRDGGYEDLLDFLMSRDFSGRQFEEIPMTPARLRNIVYSIGGFDAWLIERISAGYLAKPVPTAMFDNGDRKFWFAQGFRIYPADLLEMYRRDTQDRRMTGPRLRLHLEKYYPSVMIVANGSLEQLVFPTLEVLYDDFSRKVNFDLRAFLAAMTKEVTRVR